MNGKDTFETALADLVQKSFARRKLDAKIKDAQSLAAAERACKTCGSRGFAPSILGKDRCEYCDGTFSGNSPNTEEE